MLVSFGYDNWLSTFAREPLSGFPKELMPPDEIPRQQVNAASCRNQQSLNRIV